MTMSVKHDADKPRWDLLLRGLGREVEDVVRVLTYGARKYPSDYNWQTVTPPDRYLAAALRHIQSYASGKDVDTESGLPHIAHAVCCLLMLAWHNRNGENHE
jgi:Domain of unknown function (DUF5664)